MQIIITHLCVCAQGVEKMTDLYIERLYYFEMWESPRCLKTVADVTAVRRRSIEPRTARRAS